MLARRQAVGLNGEGWELGTATPLPANQSSQPKALRGLLTELFAEEVTLADVAAPDHSTVRALAGALMSGGPGDWRPGDGCAQVTHRVGFEPLRVRLHAADSGAALQEARAISPLSLDVLLALIDRFQAQDTEVQLLRSAEVLAAKGLRRWGDERQTLEEQIGRELMRLGRFSVGDDREPVFAVAPVGDLRTSFVVVLRPGLKAVWDAAPTRRLSRELLHYDHRANRGADVLAKKLGVYFSFAGAGSRPVVRNVGAVLKAIGVAQELACGARGGRMADRFEEAVLRLQERGVFTIAYRSDSDLLSPEVRIKGWVKRWLNADLIARPVG